MGDWEAGIVHSISMGNGASSPPTARLPATHNNLSPHILPMCRYQIAHNFYPTILFLSLRVHERFSVRIGGDQLRARLARGRTQAIVDDEDCAKQCLEAEHTACD